MSECDVVSTHAWHYEQHLWQWVCQGCGTTVDGRRLSKCPGPDADHRVQHVLDSIARGDNA